MMGGPARRACGLGVCQAGGFMEEGGGWRVCKVGYPPLSLLPHRTAWRPASGWPFGPPPPRAHGGQP